MARIPMFITGANAKIKAGNKVLGYALSVGYRIIVDHVPIMPMGRHETVSYEPISYVVTGDISNIRYLKDASRETVVDGAPDDPNYGNTTERWAPGMFNPSTLINSPDITIEIYQKMGTNVSGSNINDGSVDRPVIILKNCRLASKEGGVSRRGVLIESYSFNCILAQDENGRNIARTLVQQDLT